MLLLDNFVERFPYSWDKSLPSLNSYSILRYFSNSANELIVLSISLLKNGCNAE